MSWERTCIRSLLFAACTLGLSCGGNRAAVVAPVATTALASPVSSPPVATCKHPRPPVPPSCKPPAPQDVTPDVEDAAFALREQLYDAQVATTQAVRAFQLLERMTDEERDAWLDQQLAEIAARRSCGAIPDFARFPSFNHSEYEGTPEDPPLIAFSGHMPTDAGGLGDYDSSWGLLAVRVGCEWMPVKEGTARGVAHRDPTGRRLLVQRGIESQCAERLEAVVIRGPKAVTVFTASSSREDMVRSGVCSGVVRVELIEQDGVLLGFQTLSRTDENAPWTVVEERRFRGQDLVVVAPSSPIVPTP
jgi:hypothetical protein